MIANAIVIVIEIIQFFRLLLEWNEDPTVFIVNLIIEKKLVESMWMQIQIDCTQSLSVQVSSGKTEQAKNTAKIVCVPQWFKCAIKGDNISEIELRPVQLKLNHIIHFQFSSNFIVPAGSDLVRYFQKWNFWVDRKKKEKMNDRPRSKFQVSKLKLNH